MRKHKRANENARKPRKHATLARTREAAAKAVTTGPAAGEGTFRPTYTANSAMWEHFNAHALESAR
jgi:hypothetical protein